MKTTVAVFFGCLLLSRITDLRSLASTEFFEKDRLRVAGHDIHIPSPSQSKAILEETKKAFDHKRIQFIDFHATSMFPATLACACIIRNPERTLKNFGRLEGLKIVRDFMVGERFLWTMLMDLSNYASSETLQAQFYNKASQLNNLDSGGKASPQESTGVLQMLLDLEAAKERIRMFAIFFASIRDVHADEVTFGGGDPTARSTFPRNCPLALDEAAFELEVQKVSKRIDDVLLRSVRSSPCEELVDSCLIL